MSHRLQALQAEFAQSRRPLLMCALVAGDPHIEATLEYMEVIAENGADIIELIFPFSDSTYHGPVIQRACARALHEEVGWAEICDLAQQFRENHQIPLILSSYYNRLLSLGLNACASRLATAGFDGVMVADLPWDEAEELEIALRAKEIEYIRIVAPTTPVARFEKIVEGAKGFIVWTGHSGGDITISPDEFHHTMEMFRARTPLPIIAAMKVSTGEEAAQVGQQADGSLVGSALVWLVEGRGPDLKSRIAGFVSELRHHLDNG